MTFYKPIQMCSWFAFYSPEKIISIKPPPPITAVITCHGLWKMGLPELVYHRRLWRKYLKYLEKLYSKRQRFVLLSWFGEDYPCVYRPVQDVMCLAVCEHNDLDRAIEEIIYTKEEAETTLKDSVNVKTAQKQEKRAGEVILPPSFVSFCLATDCHQLKEGEEDDYEMILKIAIRYRQMWMAYSKFLIDTRTRCIELKNANRERKKFEDLICALLEIIYCSTSNFKIVHKMYGNGLAFGNVIKCLVPCYK